MKEKIVICQTQGDFDKLAQLKKSGYKQFEEQKPIATGGAVVYHLIWYTPAEQEAIDKAKAEAAIALQTAVPEKFKNVDSLMSVDLIKEPSKVDDLMKNHGYKLVEAWKDRASLVHEKATIQQSTVAAPVAEQSAEHQTATTT